MMALDDLKQEFNNLAKWEIEISGVEAFTEILSGTEVSPLCSWLNGKEDPIELFWRLNDRSSRLPEQWEEWTFKMIGALYGEYRVPYEPDGDVIGKDDFQESLETGHLIIPAKIKGLVTFLHIAAVRAFAITHRQGGALDEVALDCLEQVERTFKRINNLDRREMGISEVLEHDPSQTFLLSTYLVGALTYVELGRVHVREGHYQEALHYFSQAAMEANYMVERYIWNGGEFIGNIEPEPLPLQPASSLITDMVRTGLSNISPQEMADVFLRLKELGQADSWSQVTSDCKTLLESVYAFGAQDNSYTCFSGGESERISEWIPNLPDEIKNGEGWPLTWGEFWLTARAWSSAQLSPSDLMKFHAAEKLQEEDRAREREKTFLETGLKTYIFGEKDWDHLPKRAKDCLIAMNALLNSREVVAWDAIPEQLRQAAEAMCHHYLWEPYEGTINPDFPDERIEKQLKGVVRRAKDKGFGELSDCVEALRNSQYFKRFLTRRNIGDVAQQFLVQELPDALDELREIRNDATHKITESWERDDVRPCLDKFLGIGGRPGVLPNLARIGRKLRRS